MPSEEREAPDRDSKTIYDEIIASTNSPCPSEVDASKLVAISSYKPVALRRKKNSTNKSRSIPMKFNDKLFFRAAMNNDLLSLKNMQLNHEQINQRDEFGWTGLMIAACGNSIQCFDYLLRNGADLSVIDKGGNSAESLAKRKNNLTILKLIQDFLHNRQPEIESVKFIERIHVKEDFNWTKTSKKINKPFHCELCDRNFVETTRREHEASTLHQFNIKDPYRYSRRYGIPDSNRGFKIMIKQGWDRESGLGPNKNGQIYPIKTTIRKRRMGLGTKQPTAKVTHFVAFDRDAVKWKPPDAKVKNRKDLEKDIERSKRKERALRYALS